MAWTRRGVLSIGTGALAAALPALSRRCRVLQGGRQFGRRDQRLRGRVRRGRVRRDLARDVARQ